MTPPDLTVLIAEDDDQIADVLLEYLQLDGFQTIRVADGNAALTTLKTNGVAVAILDIMLPGIDGIAVCKAARQFSQIPIMMLTAKSDEEDRLLGLDTGADDYVCKPFSPREIVARVKAMIRRASAGPVPQASHAGLVADHASGRILWGEETVNLTRIEERLLRAMLPYPRRVFTRETLLDVLHDEFRDIGDRAIDTHIKNLRRKLRQLAPDKEFIHAMYGAGYYFEDKQA